VPLQQNPGIRLCTPLGGKVSVMRSLLSLGGMLVLTVGCARTVRLPDLGSLRCRVLATDTMSAASTKVVAPPMRYQGNWELIMVATAGPRRGGRTRGALRLWPADSVQRVHAADPVNRPNHYDGPLLGVASIDVRELGVETWVDPARFSPWYPGVYYVAGVPPEYPATLYIGGMAGGDHIESLVLDLVPGRGDIVAGRWRTEFVDGQASGYYCLVGTAAS